MIRVFNSKTIRALDKEAVESGEFTSLELMENAGKSIFCELKKILNSSAKVLVVCGSSNNGGDGYVVARKLFENGINVEILKVKVPVSADCIENFNRIKNVKINEFCPGFCFSEYTHIIDCVFGTGLNRELDEFYKDLIAKINASGSFIISVDNPSGLNPENGFTFGSCIKADLTLTLVAIKTGMLLNDALDFCGEIRVLDIGIYPKADDKNFVYEDADVKTLFPKKSRNRHKTTDGRVTLIAGSETMFGASYIAELGLSTMLTGAGYSTVAIPKSCLRLYNCRQPYSTILPLKSRFGKLAFDKTAIGSAVKSQRVIAIGCGLGVSKEVYKTIKYLTENFNGILVIDADGLNSIAKYGKDILKRCKCRVVLLPHVKEFSRLCGQPVDAILKNEIESAKKFAEEFNVILVLKNASTIITDGENVAINTKGTPAMAKAGSGDILCGVVSAMLLFNGDLLQACAGACYVCGKSAEIYVRHNNEYSMLSTDEINNLPIAITEISKAE